MRYKRYRDKISYIVDHLENLLQVPKNRVEKSATFYDLWDGWMYDLHTSIELVEAFLNEVGFKQNS